LVLNNDAHLCLQDILLRELTHTPEAGVDLILELWNLAVLHDLARLMEAIFRVLDLRLEAFLLDASSRTKIAQLGFEVRCVLSGPFKNF
jgi:hypothetical protein